MNLSPELVARYLVALPTTLREERERRRMSIRSAAKEMGLAFQTLSRLEKGRDVRVSCAVIAIRWLTDEGDT